jgi:hypothetical protein
MLLSQTRDCSNLEGQVPVFISPRNRVAQLYPQALGSAGFHNVRVRESQSYFASGSLPPISYFFLERLSADRIENTASNSSTIAV